MVIELTSFDLNMPIFLFIDSIEGVEQKQLNTKIIARSGKEYLVVESAAEIISDISIALTNNLDTSDLH